jgi:polyhydroxybutyrate depolymerase
VRLLALLALTAFAAAAVAGCGADGSAPRPGETAAVRNVAADPPAATAAGRCIRSAGRHTIGGTLTYVPKQLPQRPALLLAFHGLRMEASELESMTGLDGVAARRGFVVAYPSALNARKWQLNDHDGDDDVNHVRRLIDELTSKTCGDSARVYLTGFSNGASFAFRAGCDLVDKVAAIAPVSGSYASQDECAAGAVPTLEVHGSDPWTGTVTRLLTDMKRRNKCTQPAVTTRMAPGVSRTVWPGCDLERIYNKTIGHEWARTGAYDTSAQVWKFVSRYRLR